MLEPLVKKEAGTDPPRGSVFDWELLVLLVESLSSLLGKLSLILVYVIFVVLTEHFTLIWLDVALVL